MKEVRLKFCNDGFRNAIIRLSLDDFHVRERFVWETQVDDANICRNQVKLAVRFSLFQ